MNFITFSTTTTNIFPIANSTVGGQLLTEFNLRSRESVGVGPADAQSAIEYMVGTSFVHSELDFHVRVQEDGSGTPISSTVLEILPGKCLLNGHYVENLAPMLVDLTDANMKAKQLNQSPLKGPLVIGLRAMYSTLPTLASSLKVENRDAMYEGIQLVILPPEQFKLPQDVPKDINKVTAHIKLATFNFINGALNTVINNYPDKCRNIDASRIGNVDALVDDTYISKNGLDPDKLYVFKGVGSTTGQDTWCNAVDSLVTWDMNPTKTTDDSQVSTQSAFRSIVNNVGVTEPSNTRENKEGRVQLVLSHKQVDGMQSSNGTRLYYQDRVIDLPLADYNKGTPGTVDRAYTNQVKNVLNKINNLYNLPEGKQRMYIESLLSQTPSVIESYPVTHLPIIDSAWSAGDYIIVGSDETVVDTYDTPNAPSTMYVLIPGYVRTVANSSTTKPSGIEIGYAEGVSAPTSAPSYWDYTTFRGSSGDYFRYVRVDDTGAPVSGGTRYYQVSTSTNIEYTSPPVLLTGGVPLATEDKVGGFLNVPDSALDYGYVFRDSEGHLRLLDYGLLRSGTLAYQLGEDFSTPSGITLSEIQNYLNEYVNQRVAFPNTSHLQEGKDPNVITVTIDIPEQGPDDIGGELSIFDIDSRFNTSVLIKLVGLGSSKVKVNISDCEKVRIDSNIGGVQGDLPVINLYRSNIYYDSHVLNNLNEIEDMRLWYVRYTSTDPDLLVDNLTVQETNAPIIVEDADYWNEFVANDNHFLYGLKSVTFSPSGTITGCSILVKNETTSNVTLGESIMTSLFHLPQGAGLHYPESKLTKQLKVTGSFVSAYEANPGYIVCNTDFSMVTQIYDPYSEESYISGTVAFHTTASNVTSVENPDNLNPLDCWRPGSYHVFSGGAIS